MSWEPEVERMYAGPVIDRGILGEDDVPEYFASKTPFFYVTKTPPLASVWEVGADTAAPLVDNQKWLYEWDEDRGGWLFRGYRR